MRLILAAALLAALTTSAFAQCYQPPPEPKTSAIPAETLTQSGTQPG
jgi:opacity protein-like surface antigen